MSRLSLLGLIDSLESAVKKLTWQPQGTEWADYYKDTNYSLNALHHKKQLICEFLDKINPKIIWDLGANVGMFSRIASDKGIQTISFDIDPAAVEKNYFECVRKGETNILPLLLDLTNPSPNIGWENQERMSLFERGPADTVFALALIHHLAISNNLPLNKIANLLSRVCNSLIIEFVPKRDSQVQRLLSTREDIFPDYIEQVFEGEFLKYFTIESSVRIRDSERTLYLMQRRKCT
jgi:ribosomal protein L11 methylase PrmA